MLYNWEPTGIQYTRKAFEECDGHTKSELVMTCYSAVNCRRLMMLVIILF